MNTLTMLQGAIALAVIISLAVLGANGVVTGDAVIGVISALVGYVFGQVATTKGAENGARQVAITRDVYDRLTSLEADDG